MPRLLLLLLALASGLATAADPAPGTDPELERATRLRSEAKALREQADNTLAERLPGCYERFLVNRCIANEKEARLEIIGRARELELEASHIELAQRQRAAAALGRTATDAPLQPASPTPAEAFAIPADPTADATRRQREADAVRATADEKLRREQKDVEKARARTAAEAEAAKRAEAARRDRERYEERQRKRDAKKAEDAAN